MNCSSRAFIGFLQSTGPSGFIGHCRVFLYGSAAFSSQFRSFVFIVLRCAQGIFHRSLSRRCLYTVSKPLKFILTQESKGSTGGMMIGGMTPIKSPCNPKPCTLNTTYLLSSHLLRPLQELRGFRIHVGLPSLFRS